jgi:hypothetical protein
LRIAVTENLLQKARILLILLLQEGITGQKSLQAALDR